VPREGFKPTSSVFERAKTFWGEYELWSRGFVCDQYTYLAVHNSKLSGDPFRAVTGLHHLARDRSLANKNVKIRDNSWLDLAMWVRPYGVSWRCGFVLSLQTGIHFRLTKYVVFTSLRKVFSVDWCVSMYFLYAAAVCVCVFFPDNTHLFSQALEVRLRGMLRLW
jgi:hypothetical protein